MMVLTGNEKQRDRVRILETVSAKYAGQQVSSFPKTAKCHECQRAYLVNSQAQLDELRCKCWEMETQNEADETESDWQVLRGVCLIILIAIAIAGAAHYFALPELTKY